MSTGQEITINTGNGDMAAYCAMPASGSGPVVVVIQEIFGVNGFIREVCDDMAAKGYIGVGPDLFWRIEPGIQLTDKSEEEWARARELMGLFDIPKGMADIQATITHARDMAGSTGKVGAVGYCLGGALAYLTACQTDAEAAIGYYGVRIDQNLDAAKDLTTPLMLHIPTEDGFVPPEAQAKMHEALDPMHNVKLYDYAGNDHAFARTGGMHYDAAAATLANERTADFLATYLR